MYKLKLLQALEKFAVKMRDRGLHPPTRLGRYVLKGLLGGELAVDVDGLYLSGSIEHRRYLWSLREGKQEAFMAELFKTTIEPGMIVCDIGAFIGYYALLAAQRVGKTGRVYAFEPDPRNFKFLVRNIQNNGFADIITPIPKALSDKNGEMQFYLHGGDQSRSSLFASIGGMGHTIVNTITLDEFFSKEDRIINVVKMDIEGAEVHALKGMEHTIARARNLTMFVECNPLALRASGMCAKSQLAYLTNLGFTVMVIDEQEHCLAPPSTSIESVKYVNLYCSWTMVRPNRISTSQQ